MHRQTVTQPQMQTQKLYAYWHTIDSLALDKVRADKVRARILAHAT